MNGSKKAPLPHSAPERTGGLFPLKSMLNTGAVASAERLAISSLNPFEAIQVGINAHPDQRVLCAIVDSQ